MISTHYNNHHKEILKYKKGIIFIIFENVFAYMRVLKEKFVIFATKNNLNNKIWEK